MENFQEERTARLSLADRIRRLEEKKRLEERNEETEKKTKKFKWPFKWRSKFNKVNKKVNNEKILVIFLNKKNEIETPKFMPIFEGNMVVWKNKPYEFDPRAIWTIKGVKKNPRAYLIKEIDRRPVRNQFGKLVYRDASISNMDIEEIRARGDSTESDEFLVKAALRAKIAQTQKKAISWIMIIIIIAIVGGVAWFLLSGQKI